MTPKNYCLDTLWIEHFNQHYNPNTTILTNIDNIYISMF